MTTKTKRLLDFYSVSGSIKSTARHCGVSESVVRKTLITYGKYSSETSIQIAALIESGFSVSEISKATSLSRSAIYTYIPYSKGSYSLLSDEDRSANAKRIRACRERKSKSSM